MTINDGESGSYKDSPAAERGISTWLKVGAVAAASALAGGLAAAWFYRGTLHRLREHESTTENSIFSTDSAHSEED